MLVLGSWIFSGVSSLAEGAGENAANEKPAWITFSHALYYAPTPIADPQLVLAEFLADGFPEAAAVMTIQGEWVPLADYAPPSEQSLRYLGKGLSPAIAPTLAQAESVFVLSYATWPQHALKANRIADRLLARLAERTEGLPWDEECRLLYSREAWQSLRVDSWESGTPDMRGAISMHAYRDPDLVRVITLGMRKFGLPDLVVTDVMSTDSRPASNIVTVLAQRLVEGLLRTDQKFEVVLDEITHSEVREWALGNPLDGATGRVAIALTEAEPDEGDPDNLLMKLDFPEFEAASYTERQNLAFAGLFGSSDEMLTIKQGDPEMATASRRAREQFMAGLDGFRQGFAPNENLMVKIAFEVGDQTEYMWLEVSKIEEEKIQGVLANDSYYDETLRTGRAVVTNLSKVYDYLHTAPDGTQRGNLTGKVLEARHGK